MAPCAAGVATAAPAPHSPRRQPQVRGTVGPMAPAHLPQKSSSCTSQHVLC